LLSQLLVKDPSKRLGNFNGIQDIWSHPWLLGITESDVLTKRLLPPFKPNILEENFDNSDFKTEETDILSEL
jgi:serum/glucocorticoid-regulated kinase 2